MMLLVLLWGLFIIVAAGGLSALLGRHPRGADVVAIAGIVTGSLLALVPSVSVLAGGPAVTIHLQWSVPFGCFCLKLDGLSAFFLIPILVVPVFAAVFGQSYLAGHTGQRSHRLHWLFFCVLQAAMAVVVTAQNGLLFLFAWEVMSLVSFFLVMEYDDSDSVRAAGKTYLVAAHIGALLLFLFCALMGAKAGTLDFDQLSAGRMAPVLFLLAVASFGIKEGLVPLHVWLPEAHPAAPTHVSAILSGVMIKTGIYGILRAVLLLWGPVIWWGWLLTGCGIAGMLYGALFAAAQDDMKRLLAYCSVENVGIIMASLGLGLVGLASGNLLLAVLALGGGLFHVWNHALFKALLFLGAGSVAHSAHTLNMNELGGLAKRMRSEPGTWLTE